MKRAKYVVWSASIVAATALLMGSPARGQIAAESSGLFGTLGQASATITNTNPAFLGAYNALSVPIGPNACVPTATTNGLTYLENYQLSIGHLDPFAVSPNSASQINALATSMNTYNTTSLPNWQNAGGTLVPSTFNGLQTYLTNNPAPKVSIAGQVWSGLPAGFVATSLANASAGIYNTGTNVASAVPTAQFLADALNNNDGVEIGVQWGNYNGTGFTPAGGGHFLTLDAINLSNGSGTISFFDPWGPSTQPGTTTGNLITASVSTINGGFLYLAYPISWAGGDLDDTNLLGPGEQFGAPTGQTARIVVDMTEAVPEPSSMSVLIISGSAVLLSRRKRAHVG